MFTFYCIAKKAAKIKTNVSVQIVVSKKSNVCTQSERVLFYKFR